MNEATGRGFTYTGFDLTFTQPVDPGSAANPDNYKFRHYYYEYHLKYGSDQFDVQAVPVSGVKISEDHRKVSLRLGSLRAGYIYELSLGGIKSEEGEGIANKLICYTLNNLAR